MPKKLVVVQHVFRILGLHCLIFPHCCELLLGLFTCADVCVHYLHTHTSAVMNYRNDYLWCDCNTRIPCPVSISLSYWLGSTWVQSLWLVWTFTLKKSCSCGGNTSNSSQRLKLTRNSACERSERTSGHQDHISHWGQWSLGSQRFAVLFFMTPVKCLSCSLFRESVSSCTCWKSQNSALME